MKKYYTFKVPETTMEKIERFKEENGYPSYSQAITALMERYETEKKVMAIMRKTIKDIILKEFSECCNVNG